MTTHESHKSASYKDLHKPAKEFANRDEYLKHELQIMSPKRWRLNLPGRDFNFEIEDSVVAVAVLIGKIVMTAAIVAAFASGFGLSDGFVTENVRFEMIIGALFVILFSGFLLPTSNLAGCHGPMIPLIPLIVVAGGHPLAMGLMVGVLGLMLGMAKGGSRLLEMTGPGVRGGLLIVVGVMGIMSQLTALKAWADKIEIPIAFLLIILVTIIAYTILEKIGKRWLAIPLCSLLAIITALAAGAPFKFITSPGIPNLNPAFWWGADSGWMLGLPDYSHFVAVIPFAILAIAMWPPDFLGHRVFQEANYPTKTHKVLMNVDDTMVVSALRQIFGSIFGGGNLASSAGTFIIPAGIAKRPIPAGAILGGLAWIIVAIIGLPMDVALWAPVLRVALIVGVFLPLIEAGLQMVKNSKNAQSATLCVMGAIFINPVFGWSLAMVADNSGLLGDIERAKKLKLKYRIVLPVLTFIFTTIAMASIGLIPGINKFL
ncbi:MAG: DUF3360 family protein [Paludibacter sp.]|nr:DUF3360 family protein [Paludibacter sp.]